MIKKLSLAALFFGIMVAAQAQKLGHINGQMLVEHMPEYKTAYDELSTYKKQYEDALLAMRAEYEKMIEDFKKLEPQTYSIQFM